MTPTRSGFMLIARTAGMIVSSIQSAGRSRHAPATSSRILILGVAMETVALASFTVLALARAGPFSCLAALGLLGLGTGLGMPNAVVIIQGYSGCRAPLFVSLSSVHVLSPIIGWRIWSCAIRLRHALCILMRLRGVMKSADCQHEYFRRFSTSARHCGELRAGHGDDALGAPYDHCKAARTVQGLENRGLLGGRRSVRVGAFNRLPVRQNKCPCRANVPGVKYDGTPEFARRVSCLHSASRICDCWKNRE